jgi:hypothetical protein
MTETGMPRLIHFLVLFLLAPCAETASRGGADPVIRRLMGEGDVDGLSIVVIRRGTITWEKAYGVANAGTRAPLTERAIFESAALGKPVFAYTVLRLVDAGVLSLDVPLQPMPSRCCRSCAAGGDARTHSARGRSDPAGPSRHDHPRVVNFSGQPQRSLELVSLACMLRFARATRIETP